MKRWFILTVAIFWACGSFYPAPAQSYEQRGSSHRPSDDQSFEDSVDLEQFRQGNIEWDTQELIASGMKALHREHQKIVQELEQVKASLKRLEEKR